MRVPAPHERGHEVLFADQIGDDTQLYCRIIHHDEEVAFARDHALSYAIFFLEPEEVGIFRRESSRRTPELIELRANPIVRMSSNGAKQTTALASDERAQPAIAVQVLDDRLVPMRSKSLAAGLRHLESGPFQR